MIYLVLVFVLLGFEWSVLTVIDEPSAKQIEQRCVRHGGVSSASSPGFLGSTVIVCKDGKVSYW